MGKIICRFTLPLTIILFGLITKWWYGIAIDAKDVFFYGFPLIYKTEGFHTSLSTQYFLFEMLINFITYFGISLIITFTVNRFWEIRIQKKIIQIFWAGFAIAVSGFIYLAAISNDRFKMRRDFEVEIFDSGISIFEKTPDRDQYLDKVEEWSNR